MAHLSYTYGWSEDMMMNMSLKRLLIYYTTSFSLPYKIVSSDDVISEDKVIRREKKGLWTIETITTKR